MSWELRLAAMLSQIGCVTLPENVLARHYAGQSVADEAQSLYRSHPRVAGKLLASIPRLEGVAAIVASQLDDVSVDGEPAELADWDGNKLDALVLKVAADLDFWLG